MLSTNSNELPFFGNNRAILVSKGCCSYVPGAFVPDSAADKTPLPLMALFDKRVIGIMDNVISYESYTLTVPLNNFLMKRTKPY